MKGITSSMKAIGFSETESNNSSASSSTQTIPEKPMASENAISTTQVSTTEVTAVSTTETYSSANASRDASIDVSRDAAEAPISSVSRTSVVSDYTIKCDSGEEIYIDNKYASIVVKELASDANA